MPHRNLFSSKALPNLVRLLPLASLHLRASVWMAMPGPLLHSLSIFFTI